MTLHLAYFQNLLSSFAYIMTDTYIQHNKNHAEMDSLSPPLFCCLWCDFLHELAWSFLIFAIFNAVSYNTHPTTNYPSFQLAKNQVGEVREAKLLLAGSVHLGLK